MLESMLNEKMNILPNAISTTAHAEVNRRAARGLFSWGGKKKKKDGLDKITKVLALY